MEICSVLKLFNGAFMRILFRYFGIFFMHYNWWMYVQRIIGWMGLEPEICCFGNIHSFTHRTTVTKKLLNKYLRMELYLLPK